MIICYFYGFSKVKAKSQYYIHISKLSGKKDRAFSNLLYFIIP